jgi:long-chain acyl-CoA synthetase
VAAAVHPKPDTAIDVAELQAFVGERLAPFKVPTTVLVLDEPLPRNAAGKMLKRELRDRLS